MKICPFCTVQIEDDSFFCDQCGKELKICLDCGAFVRGKFCSACRSINIVSVKDNTNTTLQQPGSPKGDSTIPAKEKNPVEKTNSQLIENKIIDGLSFLIGLGNDAKIELNPAKEKYIFGRKTGDSNPIFENDKFVSRAHAQISFDKENQCWKITDLNSTNGTFVNETPVPSNNSVSLKSGDEVRIAFIKFRFQ